MNPNRLLALVRLLLETGDLSPTGARVIRLALDDDEVALAEVGVGDE